MIVARTVAEVRSAVAKLPRPLGLVPTMGYLHHGHLSLVEAARRDCAAVAATIFVNPTQFGPNEDFERYPRDAERDLALLAKAGVGLVFTPEVAEIYPPGFETFVEVGGIGGCLEGASRPGHFRGVATVVTKLFNIVQPDRAYFGQKDGQQTVVIRRLVRDLNLPVEVVVAPTVREADGLAMSSRNAYLSPTERAAAPVLCRALQRAAAAFQQGERDAERLRAIARAELATEPLADVDYVSLVDRDTLEDLVVVDRPAMLSLAVRFGTTRLIDNTVLEAP